MIEPGAGALEDLVPAERQPPAPARAARRRRRARARCARWPSQRDGVHGTVVVLGRRRAAVPLERARVRLAASRRLDPKQGRVLAYLNAAMHDATVAAWDSKYAYNRPRPTRARSLAGRRHGRAAQPVRTRPSTPPRPARPRRCWPTSSRRRPTPTGAMAEEAARSRVRRRRRSTRATPRPGSTWAARSPRSRSSGRRPTAPTPRGTASSRPGPASGAGTNPVGAADAKMQAVPARLGRPAPARAAAGATTRSSSPGSSPRSRASRARRGRNRLRARRRSTAGAARPEHGADRSATLSRRVFEEGLEDNPWAARSYALVAATCLRRLARQPGRASSPTGRPRPSRPTRRSRRSSRRRTTPSYPSNRSVLNAAPALVLGHLFPRDADRFWKEAEQIGESAIWAGIHFRSDVEAGREMGRALAKIAIDWDSR